ncbi:hypothetical protein [Raoultella terrigena]|uniref:hypothetical protein n=1 Tax=Raoultella terrigena TaxID=577 RepID=UPI0006988BC6|nr:hypothetical protein [Raoultella terrigena]
MDNARNAGTTNTTRDSLVRVVATAENTSWVTPADNAEFTLKADATIPEIVLNFERKLLALINGPARLAGMPKEVV